MANWTLRNLATGNDVVFDDTVVSITSYLNQGVWIVKIAPPSVLPATTAVVGAGAGTAPPAVVVVAGTTDKRGQMTWGTGTSPAAGNQVVVTFGSVQSSYGSMDIQAKNSVTQALGLYVVSATTSGFTVAAANAPAASQANTVFSFDYTFVP